MHELNRSNVFSTSILVVLGFPLFSEDMLALASVPLHHAIVLVSIASPTVEPGI